MAATALGPQGPNYTPTRPPFSPVVSGGVDTWAKNCSGPGLKDGTYLDADFFNVIIDQLRTTIRTAGIALDGTNSAMLYQAIVAIAAGSNAIVNVVDTAGTSTADALTGVCQTPITTIAASIGRVFSVTKSAVDNATSAPTLTLTPTPDGVPLAPATLYGARGGALAPGDLRANAEFFVIVDATGKLRVLGLVPSDIGTQLGTLHALTNLQTTVTSTRTTLSGPGDGATWVNAVSGTLTKKSATSKLAFWLSMPLWSPGPAAPTKVRVVIGGQTTRGVTQYSYSGNTYGQLAIDNILSGLPAGSTPFTIDFSRPNDSTTWYLTVNPTSADSTFYDAGGTSTSLIFGEFEP